MACEGQGETLRRETVTHVQEQRKYLTVSKSIIETKKQCVLFSLNHVTVNVRDDVICNVEMGHIQFEDHN